MKELAAADHVENDLTLHKNSASLGNAMRQTRLDIHPLFGLSRQKLFSGSNRSLAGLQPKLVVGPADDKYEREADRVAEQVVSLPQPPVQRQGEEEDEPVQREPLSARITPLVQRQVGEEDEEELQTSPMIQRLEAEEEDEEKIQTSPMVQRQAAEEEEEKLQTAPEVAGSKGSPAGLDLEQSLEQARAGGRPLAEGFRGRMENAFGADFSSVRIHADEPADRLSRSIQARAFTRGQDIFLRQGEYQPAIADRQRLLAHELTHVVRQNGETLRRGNGKLSTTNLDCGIPKPDVSFKRYASAVQRYVLVNVADSVAVNAIPGVAGPPPKEFEAQQPPGKDQLDQVLGADDPTQLRVSEDGRMAIENSDLSTRQPKVFYAEPAVWNDGNHNLTQSKYELYSDRGNAITVTMHGKTHNLDRVLARVKNVSPGHTRAQSEKGLMLDVDPDCIMVATAIIGSPPKDLWDIIAAFIGKSPRRKERNMVIAYGSMASREYGEFRTAAAMLEWANTSNTFKEHMVWSPTMLESWWKEPESKESRMALRKYREWHQDPDSMRNIAKEYARLKREKPDLAMRIAQSLGVNDYTQPGIGEAYETLGLEVGEGQCGEGDVVDWESDPTGSTKMGSPIKSGVRNRWSQHIGAVIAMSSGNRVTLENYARSHELGGLREGPDYYFQMYGPPNKPEQTWHHAWTTGSGIKVKNAVTVVVQR